MNEEGEIDQVECVVMEMGVWWRKKEKGERKNQGMRRERWSNKRRCRLQPTFLGLETRRGGEI